MKKILACVFYLLLCGCCLAQDQHLVDSLISQFKIHKQDTAGADILYVLSKAYWGADPDKAMDYAKQTLVLSEQTGYKKGQGNAYVSMGYLLGQKGDHQAALELLQKALKIGKEIEAKSVIAASYGNIGIIYMRQGNLTEALKNHFACLKIREETGDKNGTGMTYNNIAIVYSLQGNQNDALKTLLSCLKIMEEIGNIPVAASVSNNIGNIYQAQGNYPDALKNYFNTAKIQEEMGDKHGLAVSNTNIGNTYFLQANYSEALKYNMTSLKLSEEIADKDLVASAYYNIGEIYIKQAKYNDAKENLDKALLLSKEIGGLERMKTSYHALADLDSARGDFEKSLEHYKNYITLRDSIVNNENVKKTVELQMQYEFDKKDATAKIEQEKKESIARAEQDRKSVITYAISIALFLVVVIALLIYRNLKRNQKQSLIISAQKEKVEKQNKEKETLLKEIHHRVKNNLQVISSLLELQSANVEGDSTKAALLEGQTRVRSIALIHHQLYEHDNLGEIEFSGFLKALYSQVATVFQKDGYEIETSYEVPPAYLDIDTIVPLGLLVNELFTNSFKYAFNNGAHGKISMAMKELEKGNYSFTFKDSGPGLPVDFDVKKATSMGLRLVYRLAKQIGGSVSYDKSQNSFTIDFKDSATRKQND